MTIAFFITASFLALFGFIAIGGALSRAVYLKLTFDFAAIAVIGLERPEITGENRMISVCFVVIGIILTFLYFIVQRQKDAFRDEP
jgi:hypothetical protein